jgi:putative resolvase
MQFLRPKEVVDLLRVTKTTLIRMEHRGELHPIRLPNGHRRYKKEEIEKIVGEKIE